MFTPPLRRDDRRKADFLAKKNLGSKDSSESTIDVGLPGTEKVLILEPKDEIELQKPEAFEAAVDISEETVNYVAEYVYDTKLQKDDIHQTIWKTLRETFKEGVEEFSDGSTCNEKIIIVWGKCKFKKGYNRNFILN